MAMTLNRNYIYLYAILAYGSPILETYSRENIAQNRNVSLFLYKVGWRTHWFDNITQTSLQTYGDILGTIH